MVKAIKIVTITVSILAFFILGTNIWIVYSTESRVLNDLNNVPENRVAIVLGTSKRTTSGDSNQYFNNRINTAVELYENGKVSHILVSGDNQTKYYNEPQDMYLALKKQGIPDSVITLDFAGFRTLDSVVRCIEVFGQNDFTIVSQEFHGYRALFIADYYDANSVVYSAPNPNGISERVSIREILARSLAVIDLYVINKKPKFLGEKIDLSKNDTDN